LDYGKSTAQIVVRPPLALPHVASDAASRFTLWPTDSWLGGHFLIASGGAKPDNILDQISGSAQCLLRQVRVALRRSRMQVSKQSLHDIKRYTSIDQETRERMTQIMQTNIGKARAFANPVLRKIQ
jgi:hypothetical protein